MPLAYVGLGSNLGDRRATLERAMAELGRTSGVHGMRASSFHDTAPVGGPPQPVYLNAVAEVETTLAPLALLDALQGIEARLGRKREVRWGPRTLDLDLLLYGDEVIEGPRLTVPHPRMADRAFVLAPLCELAPSLVHPVLRRTMRQLHEALAIPGGAR